MNEFSHGFDSEEDISLLNRLAAVFLDRDGTLIADVGYPKDPSQVEPLPGVVEALIALNAREIPLVVVSNQSGIARGIISHEQARLVHERFLEVFRQAGVEFTGVYYCPHAPEDDCDCRKPKAGMFLQAASDWNLDLSRSIMVGDKVDDIEAGKRVGCRGVLFRSRYVDAVGQAASLSGQGDSLTIADYIVSTWKEAGPILIEMLKQNDA